jgi:hypothetical protein
LIDIKGGRKYVRPNDKEGTDSKKMNKQYVKDMLHAFVELDPSPRYRGSETSLENVWRVVGYDSISGQDRMLIDHIGGGLRCSLFCDRIKEYQAKDLGYRTFKQGRLLLKVQIDFEDDQPMRETTLR